MTAKSYALRFRQQQCENQRRTDPQADVVQHGCENDLTDEEATDGDE